MNISKIFKVFNDEYDLFKDLDMRDKNVYLTSLVLKIPFHNPFFKLNELELYFFLRNKADEFFEELGFKCLRCDKKCCVFAPEEHYLKEIGIYEEDKILLERHGLDPNGYTIEKNADQIEHIKRFLVQLNATTPLAKSVIENLTSKKLAKINQYIYNMMGYAFDLKQLPLKNGSFKCYYFDENKNECKIHPYKPLVCHTYPFRLVNSMDVGGVSIADDCSFNQAHMRSSGFDEFRNEVMGLKSYWEYTMSTMLFLREKDRLTVQNRVFCLDNKVNIEMLLQLLR